MREWSVPTIEELEVSETKGGSNPGLENSDPNTNKAVDFNS